MTRVRSLEQTLADNLAWNRARIKFVARFLLALYSQRTVNLTRLATAWSGHASEASNDCNASCTAVKFRTPRSHS